MMKRNYLNWITKNTMILFLVFLIVVLIILKIFFKVDPDQNNVGGLTPTPTPTSEVKNGGKTLNEIKLMSESQYSSFLDTLTEEEFLALPPTKYNLVDFVGYEENLFRIESYSAGKLTVKLKSGDKNEAVKALNSWLDTNTGNDPENVQVVWQ